MTRFFLTIEYDGTDFIGWQRQPSGISVQQCIEEAAQKITNKKITLYGAGRTDSGVHASGQVAHIDLPDKFNSNRVMEALNANLLNYRIKIVEVSIVKEDSHARFSALWRKYKYTILNRLAPPALSEGKVWHVRYPLDIESMKKAANYLIGTHDFTSFRASQCQSKSPVKTLSSLTIKEKNENVIIIAKAKSFLHHQVRNIVGTLQLVGCGKWSSEETIVALEKKNRTYAGPTAPAAGLILTDVKYPKRVYLKN